VLSTAHWVKLRQDIALWVAAHDAKVDAAAFGANDRSAAFSSRSSILLGITPMNDPLFEVLRAVHLTGGVFLSGNFSAPWCISVSITPADCVAFLERPLQMIGYHVVIDGRLLVGMEQEDMLEVVAGEIILFPRNDDHFLASEPGIRPVKARELIRPTPEGGVFRIDHGAGGRRTSIVCGFLASDDGFNPLITTLPRILKIDIREATSREWIEASVRFAAAELSEGRLASSSVMTRLSESLLAEAVRQYSATLEHHNSGWLNGLRDPHVGRALALIHQNLSDPWSAEGLAREVGLSRSGFVARFSALVGMPPIRYLTFWRLNTAKMTLRDTRRSIAQLAHAVGYDSEEAFSRAFKREFGVSPARWRDAAANG